MYGQVSVLYHHFDTIFKNQTLVRQMPNNIIVGGQQVNDCRQTFNVFFTNFVVDVCKSEVSVI